MSKVIMTSKQLVERLENLANRRTFYKNKYPYNLCYVHEDGRTSADCVNLYKALLNGYNVNNTTAGYFQNNLSNTGDCTEWGLMKQCSDVSTDFKKLKEGEPRLLYKDGHIGGYIGKEVTRNGKVYNCIECTAAWGGGILYSYVTNAGGRYNYKGGSKNGAWTHNGLMTPWVSYDAQPTPAPSPKKSVDEVAKEVIQGKWGVGAERKARLEAAGYDYREVQNRVNEMMKDTQNQPPQSHVEPEKVEGYVIGDTYTTQPYSGLNVRKSPSLAAPLAGNCLPRGTKIKCQEIKKVDGNVWMRIADKGWCCAKRGDKVYIK